MDTIILVSALISFIVFCVVQMIVFRFTDEDRALLWLMKIFLMVEGCSLFAGYFLWGRGAFVEIVLWHAVIFMLLVISYTLTVFSYSEASITVRLLGEISRSGSRGTTKNEIIKHYNLGSIVKRRLSRFIANGELVANGQRYRWKNSVSLFLLREKTVRLFQMLFPSWQR